MTQEQRAISWSKLDKPEKPTVGSAYTDKCLVIIDAFQSVKVSSYFMTPIYPSAERIWMFMFMFPGQIKYLKT